MMKKQLIAFLLVVAMVVCMVPVRSVAAQTTAIDNSELTPDSDGYADCPVCEESVKWTALSGEKTAAYWLSDGGHYYLSGNLSSSAADGAITVNTTAGNAACLHLNGHDITSSAGCTITYYQSSPGTLNIMGTGTVSGSGVVAASKWKAATLNVTKGATLNLYGGTFTKGASDAPVVWVWAGETNLYDGAKIVGTSADVGNYSSAVLLQNAEASFYMHGGEISGGHNKNSGGNVCINNGSFTMTGGSISGGTAVSYHGGNVYLKAGSFTMTGGSISGGSATYYGNNVYTNDTGVTAEISGGTITDGSLYVEASGTTTLSGAPVIEELKLPSGVTVNVSNLEAGADVAVNTTGVFTNTGVSANLGSFRAYNGTDSVMAGADGALCYVSNAALSFESGTTNAYCPVCAKTVSWTAVSGTLTSTKWLQPDTHYYLSGDVTYTGADYGFGYSKSGTQTTCLHLNGRSITSTTGKAASFGGGVVNIMGNGTVSGSGASYGGATIHTWGNGTLNLYGGIYTKGASQYPVVMVGAYTANFYSGITVTGTGTTPSGYALVLAESASSVLNMYGGTVENGKSTGCGGVRFYNGIFRMYGGEVRNCTGTAYGSVHIYGTAKAYISGGKIIDDSVYVAIADALTLSGAPVIDNLVVPADITVKVDTLTAGAQISISADCAVTTDDDLQAYVDAGYFVTPLEGKIVAVEGSVLIIADPPVEEPESTGPVYILGDVLYETDFESDTVGALPTGWSAGYSEGSAADGTLTSFGWGSGGTLTAQVESFGDYGKAYHFGSTNNDAFTAMPAINTMNYLYEAEVYVERGGSFGMANNFYAPTYEANGALFSSIYLNGDPAKYTYKGLGAVSGVLWDTSCTPAKGSVIKLQILSLNGKNYIMYDSNIVAVCDSRTGAGTVDHPGFYACYGGVYVLDVKVTEVFAADITNAAGRITADPVKLEAEFDFSKTQGIYEKLISAGRFATVQTGVLVLRDDVPAEELTANTEGVEQQTVSVQDENDARLRYVYSRALTNADYEAWFTLRPYVQLDDIRFYGEGVSYMPAQLANSAYENAVPDEKTAIEATFADCDAFTAGGAEQVKFTLFSDFHYKPGMYPSTIADLRTIFQRAEDTNADFVLSAGDFSNDLAGSPELYNTFRQYTTKDGKVLPAYNVYGNHELEFGNSMDTVTWTLVNDEYTDHTVVWGTADGSLRSDIGYYYFETNGFRVIGLDSEHSYNPTTGQYEHNKASSSGPPSGNTKAGSLGPEQLSWLETVLLDAADKKIPCIVVAHDGFGPDWCDTSADAEAVRALYRKANDLTPGTVLMSINGHIHTDHQGWLDGVFYLDTNTVRNNWWQETAVDHYTDEHTFLYEEYDDAGNLVATYEKKYNELTMGAKTWFSEGPISCTVTVSRDGSICIDGLKFDWAYGVVPQTTVDGVECEITSGDHWDCQTKGHILQPVIDGDQVHCVCTNSICGYETAVFTHNGIALEYADGSCRFPASPEEAVTLQLAQPDSVIRLLRSGLEIEIPADKTVTLDVNGMTAKVTGSGTLRGMDSANDAYALSAGAAAVADTVTVQQDVTGNGKRYIAITQNGSTTFHRLHMRLQAVTLRTTQAGLYYKAVYDCDSVLAQQVDAYGVVLSIDNMPGADFRTETADKNGYTVAAGPFVSGAVANSGSVFGIMKAGNTNQKNDTNGRTKIYANAYIMLKNQKVLMADMDNVGKTTEDVSFDGVALSLYDAMQLIDRNFQSYTPEQQTMLKNFYAQWKTKGMDWGLEKLA